MSLANPWMLVMALPLGVAAWRMLRRARRSGIRFSAMRRLPAGAAGWRARLAALTPFVLLAGLALMVVAAARPRSAIARDRKSVDAIAIAMAVDVSGSMANVDLTPKGQRPSENTTRLAIVKQLFAKFVEKRPDDLIGLTTFATFASTVVPLTADHELLLKELRDGVKVPHQFLLDGNGNRVGEEETNTAMGDGLAVALERLKDARPKSKIVILLSDGVSNTGVVEPDEAAAVAAKMGVRIYVIGIGVVPEYLEIGGIFGAVRRIKTSELSHEDLVRHLGFDEDQLRKIADTTGGMYFAVGDSESLERALDDIDRLEKTKLDVETFGRWEEHFVPYLLAGALLVLLAVTLSMAARRRMA